MPLPEPVPERAAATRLGLAVLALLAACGSGPDRPASWDVAVTDDGEQLSLRQPEGEARYSPGAIPDAIAQLGLPEGARSGEGFAFEAPGVHAAALTAPGAPSDVLAFYSGALPAAGFEPDARADTERGGTIVARGARGVVTVIVRARTEGGSSVVVTLSEGAAEPASPATP